VKKSRTAEPQRLALVNLALNKGGGPVRVSPAVRLRKLVRDTLVDKRPHRAQDQSVLFTEGKKIACLSQESNPVSSISESTPYTDSDIQDSSYDTNDSG
jgi:hypothetical protein